MTQTTDLVPLSDLLKQFDPKKDRFISREFQKYGYDLGEELGDLEHRSLYIKLAKTVPRHILERARSFVADANANSPARLFMWKLAQLRKESRNKVLA